MGLESNICPMTLNGARGWIVISDFQYVNSRMNTAGLFYNIVVIVVQIVALGLAPRV